MFIISSQRVKKGKKRKSPQQEKGQISEDLAGALFSRLVLIKAIIETNPAYINCASIIFWK